MPTGPREFFDRPLVWWSTLIAMCLLLVAPLMVASVPPVLDYPNHLARLFVLSHAANDPVLRAIWQPHWSIIPDLAADLLILPLMYVMTPLAAGKVMLALALLAPVVGVVAYSRAAFGARLYWPMTAGFLAYNIQFVMGFINCLISIGGALLAAALWLRLRNSSPGVRALAGAMCATALFVAHIMGLAFFAVLVGAAEASDLEFRRGWRRLVHGVWQKAWLFAAVFAIPIFLWVRVPHHTLAVLPTLWTFAAKGFYLVGAFLGYHMLPGAAVAAIFLTLTGVWLVRHDGQTAPGGRMAIVTLLVLWAILPFNAGSGLYVDARAGFMLLLTLSAGLRPPEISGRLRGVLAVTLALALIAQTALIGATWHAHEAFVAEVRAGIAAVPRGSKVLAVWTPLDRANAYWRDPPAGIVTPGRTRTDAHLPALLAIDRQAFWPLMFSDPSQHPLAVQPPYDTLVGEGDPPELAALIAEHQVHSIWPAPYLENWPAKFDFVLLLDAGAVADLDRLMPDRLELVNRSRFAALFRVRKTATANTQ